MLDYKREILSHLIELYENSSAYKTGVFKRRVLLYPSKLFSFKSYSEKLCFNESLEALRKEGILDYRYEKFEEGNLVKEIWLVEDEEKIERAYLVLGLVNPKLVVSRLSESLKSGTFGEFEECLCRLREKMEEKKKPSSPFCLSISDNEDLLKAISFLSSNKEEVLERVLSIKLYGDSKHFERCVRDRLIRFLSLTNENLEKEDLLASYGVVSYPELLYFKGRGELVFSDGGRLSLSHFPDGFYLDTRSLENLEKIAVEDERVLLVENKASYYECVLSSTFIFYHAGFLSPQKKKFLNLLYSSNMDKEYLHWSDIDLGGFLIHNQIKVLIPGLRAFRMDIDTLKENEKKALPIKEEGYLEKLEHLIEDEVYATFHETIRYMLEHRIRLEQETLAY